MLSIPKICVLEFYFIWIELWDSNTFLLDSWNPLRSKVPSIFWTFFPFGANKTCARGASGVSVLAGATWALIFFWWRKDRKPVYQIVEKKNLLVETSKRCANVIICLSKIPNTWIGFPHFLGLFAGWCWCRFGLAGAGILWEENTVGWLVWAGWNQQANKLAESTWFCSWETFL